MDIIKQILKDYSEGRISRTNAEYQASMQLGGIRIVEIPDDANWEISEYDGCESVEEVHRSWY